MEHLISIHELGRADVERIFAEAAALKARQRRGEAHRRLAGRTLGMLFEKPSTRTRVSFEVGMAQLGGHAVVLTPGDTQLGRGETVADTARVLSRYVDGLMARTFAHATVVELARHGSVPVINGLTDRLHPCQVLADYFTLAERFGRPDEVVLAYVGDGNNMCHSLLFGAAKLGGEIRVATPPGYGPDPEVVRAAQADAAASGATLVLTGDPRAAVDGAHVVYTDTWASMGQEEEHAARLGAFAGYQVNEALMARARPEAVFMHCLPAHRGEEVTDGVMDGPQSIILDQAENRLHVQKAILVLLLKG